ncbi:MAG: hypothetical protein ABWJ97_00780 [Thermoproteus sp.]
MYCDPALAFLSLLNEELERRGLGSVVIVGGFAVELYSGGAYRTGDIDFVIHTTRPEEAYNIFTVMAQARGWRKISRVYEGPGPLYLDLVGFSYVGRRKELRACGSRLYVQSPEDAVVSSTNACVYWDSPADCERAAAVLAAQWNSVDWDYLFRKASESSVLKKLEELVDRIRSIRETRQR